MPQQVFIVDDDTPLREMLYEHLKRQGYDVMTATSGAQAIDAMKTYRAHVILVDSAMPGLSGLETAKKIRDFDQSVPIILMKSAGELEHAPQALQAAGIVGVLHKELGVELFLGAVEQAVKQALASAAGASAPVPGKVGKILAIDDDAAILRMLTLVLGARGLEVITAGSGEEGLKALAQRPDAVLLNVNMPGMDGLMTLKKIKAAQPKLPVIMASAWGEEATVKDALATGAYDYVTKPFNLEYLETVVLTKVLLGIEG